MRGQRQRCCESRVLPRGWSSEHKLERPKGTHTHTHTHAHSLTHRTSASHALQAHNQRQSHRSNTASTTHTLHNTRAAHTPASLTLGKSADECCCASSWPALAAALCGCTWRGSAPSVTRAALRCVVGPQLNERDGAWLSSAVERIAARHAIETRCFRTAEQCMRVLCAR